MNKRMRALVDEAGFGEGQISHNAGKFDKLFELIATEIDKEGEGFPYGLPMWGINRLLTRKDRETDGQAIDR